jgi:hypothetical protein
MKKLFAGIALLCALAGCDNLKPPEVGQSADQAYGTATAQGSVAGDARSDVQALQAGRENDAQVINAAQQALGQR